MFNLNYFGILVLCVLSIHSAQADTVKCRKYIGVIEDKTFSIAKGNYKCFSTKKSAQHKGYVSLSSLSNLDYSGDWVLDLESTTNTCNAAGSTTKYALSVSQSGSDVTATLKDFAYQKFVCQLSGVASGRSLTLASTESCYLFEAGLPTTGDTFSIQFYNSIMSSSAIFLGRSRATTASDLCSTTSRGLATKL